MLPATFPIIFKVYFCLVLLLDFLGAQAKYTAIKPGCSVHDAMRTANRLAILQDVRQGLVEMWKCDHDKL